MSKVSREKKLSTRTFTTRARGAQKVRLAGSFNGWDPGATPMNLEKNGLWSVTLELDPGRYEYKFVVDGEWRCEEACEGSHPGCPHCTPNAFGGKNCVLEFH